MPVSHAEPRRQRILLLLSGTFVDGGIQRFNRTLLAACGELPVTCDVYSLADTPESIQRWPLPSNMRVRVFGGRRARYVWSVAIAMLRARYDVLVVGHVHLLGLAAMVASATPWSRPRMVLIAHGVELWTGVRGFRRRALQAVREILCVSSYTQRMIQAQAPELADERFRIFPNALDEGWGKHGYSRVSGPALPERFILSVGRLNRDDRRKGVLSVIEALALLDDKGVQYAVAGNGDDMDFLRLAARRCQVADRVHFLGSVSDQELVSLYRRCLAFVLPSGQEGFGIVFIEAMYFGAPVIAASEKGALDVVRHEQTGLLVRYGDVISLKAAIERMLADGELRERLRAGARAMVEDGGVFTFRAFVQRWADVVGTVVT